MRNFLAVLCAINPLPLRLYNKANSFTCSWEFILWARGKSTSFPFVIFTSRTLHSVPPWHSIPSQVISFARSRAFLLLLRLHTSTCGVYRVVFSRFSRAFCTHTRLLVQFNIIHKSYHTIHIFWFIHVAQTFRIHRKCEIFRKVYTRGEKITHSEFSYSYRKFSHKKRSCVSLLIVLPWVQREFWHDISRACRLTFIWCVNYCYVKKRLSMTYFH